MNVKELHIISDHNAYEQIMMNLENLYDSYYLQNNGICQYYGECSEEAINNNCVKGYNSNYAAKVGENFALKINGKDIRIVVVGKEAKDKSQYFYPPARLIIWEKEIKVNQHYQETYKILCEMLNYNWQFDADENTGHTKDTVKYCYKQDAVLTAYTLTNWYRCAFKENKIDTQVKENSANQKKYCSEFLRKELEVLKPTVLIIQENGLSAKDLYSDADQPTDYTANDKLYHSAVNNCYIIEMCHPAVKDGRIYKKSVEEFRECVKYLRSKDVLPTEDTTEALNELDKQS